jgi:hypothetical protein
MAGQYRRVTGNPSRRKAGQQAVLQSRINMLPQLLQAQQQRAQIARDTQFQNQQMSLQKKQLKQRDRESEVGMGLEAGKLGLTLGMSDAGKKTFGDLFSAGSGMVHDVSGGRYGTAGGGPKGEGNMLSNFNIGGGIASGLTGYGVGKMIGGKNKTKKGLYGAGSGALMGLLSSKKGQGLSGMISGGLLGGLGGIFS